MISGIFYAHSGWRYIVILVLILALVKALIGWIRSDPWTGVDHWLGLLTPIVLDIQVLLGLVLWILQRRWTGGDVLASWEHPVTMLIVVAIAHITWTRVKVATDDTNKFRKEFIGYLLAGIFLALGIIRITSGV